MIYYIIGSGKALRGVDGSMDEAVEGINEERTLIFNAFALGLLGNLCTVLLACFVIMDPPVAAVTASMVVYTLWLIFTNARRIQNKFVINDAVRLDDLTHYKVGNLQQSNHGSSSSLITMSSVGGRNRKNIGDYTV